MAQLDSQANAGNVSALIGVICPSYKKRGRPYYNSAVLLKKDKKLRIFNKQLLPTGDVFDEARFIESGEMEKNTFKIKTNRVLVTICEDIWAWPDAQGRSQYKNNPLVNVAQKIGALDLVVNMSASPFYPGKLQVRHKLVQKTAKLFGAPVLYCNLVGGQDEIILTARALGAISRDKWFFNWPHWWKISEFGIFLRKKPLAIWL